MSYVLFLLKSLYNIFIGITEVWTLLRVMIIAALSLAFLFKLDLLVLLDERILRLFLLHNLQ